MKQALFLPCCADEGRKTQSVEMTCPRSWSCSLAQPELRLGLPLTLKLTLVPMLFLLWCSWELVCCESKWRWNNHSSILGILLVMFSVETSFLCFGLTCSYLKLHLPEIARQERGELIHDFHKART